MKFKMIFETGITSLAVIPETDSERKLLTAWASDSGDYEFSVSREWSSDYSRSELQKLYVHASKKEPQENE